MGVIRTLHHRCNAICTSEETILAELEQLKNILSISGYSCSSLDVATTVRPSRPLTSHSKSKENTYIPEWSVALPYVAPTTKAVAKNICKTRIQVHIPPTNTNGSKLVHLKDPVDKVDKAGVVNKVECNEISDKSQSDKSENKTFKHVSISSYYFHCHYYCFNNSYNNNNNHHYYYYYY